jgi:uncharacterized RmlC-like cupin family protein
MKPYPITLHEEARPYTSFRHEGVKLIYMLSGRVRYRHGENSYDLSEGDSLMFDSAAPHSPELLIERPMNCNAFYGRDIATDVFAHPSFG